MNEYRVEFAIDVGAENPTQACQVAWAMLAHSDCLPIGTVIASDTGKSQDIDLQEIVEEKHTR